MLRKFNCLLAVALVCGAAGLAAGQGLTTWFAFENNLLDTLGGSYSTTVTGAPTYVAGQDGYGQAISLVGATDQIEWADVPKPQAFTVSIWIKLDPETPGSHKTWLLDTMELAGVAKGWQIKLQRTSTPGSDLCALQWIWGKGDGSRKTIFSSVGMYDGEWHHIVGTYDGVNTGKLYLNGTLLTEGTSAYMPASAAFPMTLNHIAQDPLYGTSEVDDIALWNKALSDEEVAELNDNGISWPLRVAPTAVQSLVALEDSPPPGPVTYTISNEDSAAHTINIAEVDENGDLTDHAWLSLSSTQIVDLASMASTTVDAIIDHSALPPRRLHRLAAVQ